MLKLIFIFLLFFMNLTSFAKAESDAIKLPCGIYAITVCFPVIRDINIKYSNPADFYIYDIKLGEKVTLSIYEGFYPDIPKFKPSISFKKVDGGNISVYKRTQVGVENYDILYVREDLDWAYTVHIKFSVTSQQQGMRAKINNFISGIKPCMPTHFSRICRQTAPLSNLLN